MAGGGPEPGTRPLLLKGAMKKKSGFTLVELMVSTFILAVGMVALLGTFLSGLILVETGRSRVVAAADARAVFEEMRRVSSGGMVAVTNPTTPWPAWARGQGLTTLDTEGIATEFWVPGTTQWVDLRNPPAVVQVVVIVSWGERGRKRSARFMQVMTKR